MLSLAGGLGSPGMHSAWMAVDLRCQNSIVWKKKCRWPGRPGPGLGTGTRQDRSTLKRHIAEPELVCLLPQVIMALHRQGAFFGHALGGKPIVKTRGCWAGLSMASPSGGRAA
jgi:hypothetical protein